jgi:hypothetical protein
MKKDLYGLVDYSVDADCLEVGTAIQPENEQMYKWAIFCGPGYQGSCRPERPNLDTVKAQTHKRRYLTSIKDE